MRPARYLTCSKCGSRYRAPRTPRLRVENDMGAEYFRAMAWLHFWHSAGCPNWRARAFGLKFGDGLIAEDLPL